MVDYILLSFEAGLGGVIGSGLTTASAVTGSILIQEGSFFNAKEKLQARLSSYGA